MPAEMVLVIDDSPTILKVVQLVLARAGFRVETAADGEAGLALARASRPALILLDLVMPRMNGHQFCRELAADPALRTIPVVLMSAKGDQVGEQFVKVMGVVDYITKPFSPEAIAEVVAKYVQHQAETPVTGDAGEGVAGGEDEAAAQVHTGAAAEEARAARVASALSRARDRIAALVAGAAGAGESAEVAAQVSAALDDGALAEILTDAAAALDVGPGAPCLRGDVGRISLVEVLQLVSAQEHTGTLTVERGEQRVSIYIRKGRIDMAVGAGLPGELFLGCFVVAGELMTREALDEVLAARSDASGLIGRELVERGHISGGELASVLRQQASALIYEVLRWSEGRFALVSTRELPHTAVDAALGLDVEVVLMEGLRRVDEWHLIEREVNDFDQVFLRNEEAVALMGPARLTREELAVLELIDGKNTVKDIIRRSRMGSFDVSRMLYRLLAIKLIRRRVMPVAV